MQPADVWVRPRERGARGHGRATCLGIRHLGLGLGSVTLCCPGHISLRDGVYGRLVPSGTDGGSPGTADPSGHRWAGNPCRPTPTHQHVPQETRVPLLRLLSTPAPQRKDTHLPPCSCRDLCPSCTCSPRPHFLGSARQGHTPGFPGVSEQSPTTFASPDVSAKLTPCNLLSPLPHICKNSKDEARPTGVLRLSPRTARVCSSPWPGGTRHLSNLKRLSCPCIAEIITWSLTR